MLLYNCNKDKEIKGSYNMNELVGLLQKGSWYQVCWNENNVLMTYKLHGKDKLEKYLKIHSIKHTAGHPFVLTAHNWYLNKIVRTLTVC